MEKYGEGKQVLHAVVRKDSLSSPVEEWTGRSALQLIELRNDYIRQTLPMLETPCGNGVHGVWFATDSLPLPGTNSVENVWNKVWEWVSLGL